MNIIAVTQARYGSTRLPAKVLKEVNGKTLLQIHLERILKSELISSLVVATTDEDGSSAIIDIANRIGLRSYKGSINDVLERFYFAVKDEAPDYVVRVTSDCPLIDPIVIDAVVKCCLDTNADYVSNTLNPTFPDGVDVEIFKFSALQKAYFNATLKSDREHVTPYIWRNSTVKGGEIFTSVNYANGEDLSKYRITVDTQEDFEVIASLIKELGTDKTWLEYINYLEMHPEIKELNSNHTRNEGYAKSLLND